MQRKAGLRRKVDYSPSTMTEDYPWLKSIFSGLQISLLQLLGLVIGYALALPISLNIEFRLSVEAASTELSPTNFIWLGINVLLVGIVGTWTSLGLFGRAARISGGKKMVLLVQVLGIIIAARVTLPVAVFLTIVIMITRGNAKEQTPRE